MRKIVLILWFASACSCAIAEPPREHRILITPRSGLALEALDEILMRHGARRVDVIPQINVHIVEVQPGSDARAVAKLLGRYPEIKDAEVDERAPPAPQRR